MHISSLYIFHHAYIHGASFITGSRSDPCIKNSSRFRLLYCHSALFDSSRSFTWNSRDDLQALYSFIFVPARAGIPFGTPAFYNIYIQIRRAVTFIYLHNNIIFVGIFSAATVAIRPPPSVRISYLRTRRDCICGFRRSKRILNTTCSVLMDPHSAEDNYFHSI